MIKIGHRQQRTLRHAVAVRGTGLVTGQQTTIRFCPAPADAGVAFLRTDLPRSEPIPARAHHVTGTQRRTTLGRGANQVTLAEHALAAVAGMRIDNCMIELDGPEPPGFDGSSWAFAEAIIAGGIRLQTVPRSCWTVREPVLLRHDGASLSFFPGKNLSLRISYLLDYGPNAPIAPQMHTETITPDRFYHDLAHCRTFLLEQEARELQERGVGKHLAIGDLVIFGPRGPIGNTLHHPNEPARHKILDLVGDLALCGIDLAGHIVAFRSGHPLNVDMARTLDRMAQRNCVMPACLAA